jgi:hypothetical protein
MNRILIIAKPELSRELEAPFRRAGWSVYRSPNVSALALHLSSIQPQALLIGLDAPWFDRGTLGGLGAVSEWNLPVFALTSHTRQIVEGPVTLLPAETPVAEIVERVESAVAKPATPGRF